MNCQILTLINHLIENCLIMIKNSLIIHNNGQFLIKNGPIKSKFDRKYNLIEIRLQSESDYQCLIKIWIKSAFDLVVVGF